MAEASVSRKEANQNFAGTYQKRVGAACKPLNLNQSEIDLKNCVDTNGDNCDILPNNNVYTNIGISNCYSDDDECTNSLQEGNMTSPQTPSSSLPAGESSEDVPSQESDTHSQHPGGSYDPQQQPVSEQSNGAIKKSRNKVSKSRKKDNVTPSPGRGRPRKTFVAMYHSQISGDKNAIKIRIKKSNFSMHVQLPPNKKKSGRRKKHKMASDTDASDCETKSKRNKTSSSISTQEPLEQSTWGDTIPTYILHRIFQNVCTQEGCLPVLIRLCRVCKLWKNVALTPTLWKNIDLNWVRDRHRTDFRLHWLIQNRLTYCNELNLGDWKVDNIQTTLQVLSQHCPDLQGLTLSGWKGLNADHLKYISTECSKLQRLDLSSISVTAAINAQPLVSVAQSMNSRLTHLVLAHNKLAGFPQVLTAIATNCPNLQLLDISNVRTFAHNNALLNIEKLQAGCPKLRVLRITNSLLNLTPASLTEQVASPGFPNLEELSLAGVEENQLTARFIDDDGVGRILKNSTKLRLLDVRGCIRLTDSGLVRVPAWDLEHLFLSGCYVTRMQNSGLELILQKWSHSLLEVDLAWSTATESLDAAVLVLAEKGAEAPLKVLNLCGSSVGLEPVKAVLVKCPKLHSINLQSCRALPRGIKRLYTGETISELRQSLESKPKTENSDSDTEKPPKKSAAD